MSFYNKYYIFLFFILFTLNISGQSNKDQLRTLYKTINERISDKNIEGIEDSIDSLKTLSIKSNDTLYKFFSRILLATVHYNNKDFDLAEPLLKENRFELKSIAPSSLKDSLLIADYSVFAHFYYRKDDYPNAVKNYIEQLKISKKTNDSVATRNAYNYLGMISVHKKSHKDAISQFQEALKYATTKFSKHDLYGNIGTAYYYLKNYENAEKYVLKSTEYINPKNKLNLYSSYTNLAGISLRNNKKKKALDYCLKAYEVSKELNSIEKRSKALLNLGSFYSIVGKKKKAKEFMRKADSVSNNITSINYKKNLYLNLFKSYRRLEDYENALLSFEKHIKFKDSLFSKKNQETIEELHLAYKTEQNQDKIKNQEALIVSEKNKNTGLLIGLGLILTAMVFLYFLHKKRLSIQKKLLKKQEELAYEKMNTVLERQKVRTYQSHIEGQNKERTRIAKDLHDSISGNLAAIKMKLSNIKVIQSEEIDAVISNLDTTYNEVRTISHNLLPQEIIKQTFTENIEQLVLLYTSETLKIDVDTFPDKEINKLPQKMEVELYRILQELITNIIKHAEATKCTISITLHDNYLNLIVEDNGIGYNTNKKSKGIGLSNILSRVKSMNGSLDIDSLNGKGTTVNINISIN